ncbi:MAG TPA: hypothetical protein VIV60_23220, partial [Polyangiaceae bacterium]
MASEITAQSTISTAVTDRPKAIVLRETRFSSEWNRPDWVAMSASVGAGLLLGAGVYSNWMKDPSADYSSFLLLGGVAAAALFGFRMASAPA